MPGPAKLQYDSKVEWVDVALLNLDPLNRPSNTARSREIAADFDVNLLGIPLVRKKSRGNGYFVIDGGHRLAALEMMNGTGPQQIQVEVASEPDGINRFPAAPYVDKVK